MNVNILTSILNYATEFLTVNAKPLLQIYILPGLAFILLFAMIAVWFERKFLARAMLRVGPYYCGKRSGALQVIADFMKLFMKEIIVPEDMNFLFFAAMPVLVSTIPALALILGPRYYGDVSVRAIENTILCFSAFKQVLYTPMTCRYGTRA